MQCPLYRTEKNVTLQGNVPQLVGLYGKKTVLVINAEPIGIFMRKPRTRDPNPVGPDPDPARPFTYARLPPGTHEFRCLNEVWLRGIDGHASTKAYAASTRTRAEPKPWETGEQ